MRKKWKELLEIRNKQIDLAVKRMREAVDLQIDSVMMRPLGTLPRPTSPPLGPGNSGNIVGDNELISVAEAEDLSQVALTKQIRDAKKEKGKSDSSISKQDAVGVDIS